MGKWLKFSVKDEDTLIRGFLSSLMEKGVVQGIIAPSMLPSMGNAAQSLITNPKMLENTKPLAPVMAVSTAKILSQITRLSPLDKPVAVLLRPCELRAATELVKLKQAHFDNLLLVSMDCAGTYSVKTYTALSGDGEDPQQRIQKAWQGEEDDQIRPVCLTCEWSVPEHCDIIIARHGLGVDQFGLIARTEKGETALEALSGGDPWEGGETDREAAVAKWNETKIAARDTHFEALKGQVAGIENLLKTYSPCINCHNCMTVCPICFCKECFFNSAVFDFDANRFMDWSQARGGLRLPSDTLLFHLGRMNHMATSCVACGMCQDACPNDVPVAEIFKMVGFNAQARFEYVAGRSLDEPVPLTQFREDELHEIGGE